MRTRSHPDWTGIAVVTLTAAVGLGWAVALVITMLTQHTADLDFLRLLLGIGEVLAGGVVAVLGIRIGQTIEQHSDRDT